MLKPEGSFNENYVQHTPYYEFNPREYAGRTLPTVEALKEQLSDIYNYVDSEYHQILQDENLLKNIDALDATQVQFLEDFKNLQITEQNFPKVMQIIQKLTRGVMPVSIKRDELQDLFSRPIAPDELITKFRQLVESKLVGIDRSNARISLD